MVSAEIFLFLMMFILIMLTTIMTKDIFVIFHSLVVFTIIVLIKLVVRRYRKIVEEA